MKFICFLLIIALVVVSGNKVIACLIQQLENAPKLYEVSGNRSFVKSFLNF